MSKTPNRFILMCLVTTAWAAPALAEDTPPVVDVLLKNIERQTQVKPAYESIEADGSAVIINKLSAQGPGGEVSITIDKVTLEDVSGPDNGLYTIGSASFEGVKAEGKGADGKAFSADMPEAQAEDWTVKDAGDNPSPADALRASMTIAKSMSSGKITVTAEGQSVTSDGFESTWDGDPATGAGNWSSKVTNIVIPAQLVALADPSGTLKNMGYGDLSFELSGDGKTTVGPDAMGMDMNVMIAGKDIASLKIGFAADKIPLAVYAELQKAQSSGKEPDFSALMPQIQTITLGGLTFRYEDASITAKLMPMIAAASGMGTKEQLVANAGAMAQVGLMQLNNPEFTNQVVGAINTFMKDPKSFTIAFKPESPVTVQQLMGLNPNDPGAAIKTLGVSVTAND